MQSSEVSMFPLYSYRLLVSLVGGFLALGASVAFSGPAKAADVLTQRYDTARTGSTTQPGFNPQAVQSQRWGELGRLQINGIVYAQPLYVENVQAGGQQGRDLVFLVTGSNQIYAFDTHTLGQVWHVDLGLNDKTTIGSACDWLSLPGGMGTEATPVIDSSNSVMYVSYRVNPSGELQTAQQHLRAIDIRDGHEIADLQVLPPQASTDWTQWHRSRAGLLLLNGVVYVAFASRCEDPGTKGFHG
jgi:outer membrane protein assembly factor BamB